MLTHLCPGPADIANVNLMPRTFSPFPEIVVSWEVLGRNVTHLHGHFRLLL